VSISGSLRSLLSVRTLRLTCLLAAVIFTVQASFLSFLPIYASERLGMAELDVGAMFTVATALQIAVTPLVGKFSDRVDNRRLLAGIFVASAALFGLIPFASSPVHLYLISAGISVTCVSGVIAMSIHSANTPRNLSGTSIGLYGTFEDLGLIIGSSLYGLSWGSLGPNSVFYLASAASLAGIAVTASLRRGND
jgi:predicted MFS family arabinose efflux permease